MSSGDSKTGVHHQHQPRLYRKHTVWASLLSLALISWCYFFSDLGHTISQNSVDTPPRLPRLEHLKDYCADVPPITASEFIARQKALAKILADKNLRGAAYIAEPGADALYFANISESSWQLSERPLLVIISPFQGYEDIEPVVTIITPKFEASRAKLLSIPAQHLTFVEWEEDEDPYQIAARSLPTTTFPQFRRFYLSGSTRRFIGDGFASATGMVTTASLEMQMLRERKSPAEIALLRCVNEATLLSMKTIQSTVYLGISQSDTSKLLSHLISSAGLTNTWSVVLFGPNAAFPHGGSTDRQLQKEDFILIDAAASLHGYKSDITRTFALESSEISNEHLVIWEVVRAAQQAALEAAKDGAITHIVDDAARKVISDASYGEYFTHRLGHGIGLETHESPYLRGKSDRIIQTGHTYSNEPGIYIPDKLGVRLEDVFVIDEDGSAVYLTENVGGAAKSPWEL